jgi:hypothetical protein
MKFINVRGANGSGKTTVLRRLALSEECEVKALELPASVDHKPIPVTYCPGGIAILGDYRPNDATTAGCDRIKTQEAIKCALEILRKDPNLKVILFEGVVVSTIFGPWKDWSRANGGMIWAFLDTPLRICLDRIQMRNGGKPINEEMVKDKIDSISRARTKARQDGERVADLRWEFADADLGTLIRELQNS